MKHLSLIPSEDQPQPSRLAVDTLNHLVLLSREQLSPSQAEHLFHETGKRLGREAWRRYRTPFRLARRPSVKDMVQCIASLEELWNWPCTILQQTEDHISISAPPPPFATQPTFDLGHRMIPVLVMAGILEGIAEAAFGYGKVASLPSEGAGRAQSRLVIHLQPTAHGAAGMTNPSRKSLSHIRPRGKPAGENAATLTRRERQILQCVGHALSNKEIAGQLGISVRTVEGHVSRTCVKLDLRRRADLIRFAIRNKLATL